MVGLLTRFLFSHLPAIFLMTVVKQIENKQMKLTVAGTVPDFNGIPY